MFPTSLCVEWLWTAGQTKYYSNLYLWEVVMVIIQFILYDWCSLTAVLTPEMG